MQSAKRDLLTALQGRDAIGMIRACRTIKAVWELTASGTTIPPRHGDFVNTVWALRANGEPIAAIAARCCCTIRSVYSALHRGKIARGLPINTRRSEHSRRMAAVMHATVAARRAAARAAT